VRHARGRRPVRAADRRRRGGGRTASGRAAGAPGPHGPPADGRPARRRARGLVPRARTARRLLGAAGVRHRRCRARRARSGDPDGDGRRDDLSSSGLGRATAQVALEAGHTVVGTVRTSFYQGSKFAVEGILETLGKEVAHLGIHVTAVAPGSFRTDWAGRSMVRSDRSIPDYDEVMTPIREHRLAASGNQLGDPRKAGEAILTIVEPPDPPAHLVLGPDRVAHLGIPVAAFAPGSFRTDWAGRSMVRSDRSIPDYDEVMTPIREHRLAASGNQLGDPRKAGEAILTIVETPAPPAHLVLG